MPDAEVEVVSRYESCPHCGPLGYFEIHQLEADARGRWAAQGTGRIAGYCPNCGMLCQLIIARLPVELDSLPCPRCAAQGNYRFTLTCVRTRAGEFEFAADVRCSKCSAQSAFRKVTASLRRIRGITVGPIGLELDTASEDR